MKNVRTKVKVAALSLLAVAAAVALVFVLIEGLSSVTIVAHEVLFPEPGNGRSQYDEFLGWAPIPKVFQPNGYGQAKYVRINARGFRADEETEVAVPQGKVRLICSGDSFTFGQGVANDRTWCHLLSILHPHIETVNLGYPGYGVDQAFLRYQRDGSVVDHDVHVFGFVSGDFDRMGRRAHHGVQKPVLRLQGNELIVHNVPVSRFKTRSALSIQTAAERLRSVDFFGRVWLRLFGSSERDMDEVLEKIGPLALRVFMELDQLAKWEGAVVVFVYLPTALDLRNDAPWFEWVRSVTDSLELNFVNLRQPMRNLPHGESATFFIPRGTEDGGHYTEAGNRWVAEVLLAELQQIPGVKDGFGRMSASRER